uniref:(northern house mosquito) hypothetical protein n=1 Tax=Culex pipiens TaxID=7175 RepID=A0A8D8F0Q3_CULPI
MMPSDSMIVRRGGWCGCCCWCETSAFRGVDLITETSIDCCISDCSMSCGARMVWRERMGCDGTMAWLATSGEGALSFTGLGSLNTGDSTSATLLNRNPTVVCSISSSQ